MAREKAYQQALEIIRDYALRYKSTVNSPLGRPIFERVLYASPDTLITLEIVKALPFESEGQRAEFLYTLRSLDQSPFLIDRLYPAHIVHQALAFCGWNPNKFR